jgi:tellurite resistance protein TehA-like permease
MYMCICRDINFYYMLPNFEFVLFFVTFGGGIVFLSTLDFLKIFDGQFYVHKICSPHPS